MPWGPEDWTDWLDDDRSETYCTPAHLRALREVLRKIPDAHTRDMALVRGALEDPLGGLADRFARIVTVNPAPGGQGFPRRFGIAVAFDSITGERGLDVVKSVECVHGMLAEGGIFVGTFPARLREERPFTMQLSGRDSPRVTEPFHETELQYLLHRAGFHGLRIRRFPGDVNRPEALLCMGVRRACN